MKNLFFLAFLTLLFTYVQISYGQTTQVQNSGNDVNLSGQWEGYCMATDRPSWMIELNLSQLNSQLTGRYIGKQNLTINCEANIETGSYDKATRMIHFNINNYIRQYGGWQTASFEGTISANGNTIQGKIHASNGAQIPWIINKIRPDIKAFYNISGYWTGFTLTQTQNIHLTITQIQNKIYGIYRSEMCKNPNEICEALIENGTYNENGSISFDVNTFVTVKGNWIPAHFECSLDQDNYIMSGMAGGRIPWAVFRIGKD